MDNKIFKLPEPPLFTVKAPPIPPLERSHSFLRTIDYLYEMTKNTNKCLNLVNTNNRNQKLINDNSTLDDKKMNYILVIFTVFIILLIIIFLILILHCIVKYNFVKILKKIFTKFISFFKIKSKKKCNFDIKDNKKLGIIVNNNISSISNIYEKINTNNKEQEDADNYNHLVRFKNNENCKIDSSNFYFSILTVPEQQQQQFNEISNAYYSINIQ